jgi:hypothetical protein
LKEVVVNVAILIDVSISPGEDKTAIRVMTEEDKEGSEPSHAVEVGGWIEFLGSAIVLGYSILYEAWKEGEADAAKSRPPCLYSTYSYERLDASIYPLP